MKNVINLIKRIARHLAGTNELADAIARKREEEAVAWAAIIESLQQTVMVLVDDVETMRKTTEEQFVYFNKVLNAYEKESPLLGQARKKYDRSRVRLS